MAAEERDEGEKGIFEQDPFVEQMRPEPSAPPSEVVILEGLAGRSDREGWARLYFNRTLTYYAEFRREDIVFTEAIPPEQAPIMGLKCTRVGIRKDAVIEYTRATRARPRDEFDLDVQLAARRQPLLAPRRPSLEAGCSFFCGPPTWAAECDGGGGGGQPTVTCFTACGQVTECRGTCNTCRTDCDQATCITCNTCETCRTRCETCTCETCRPTRCGCNAGIGGANDTWPPNCATDWC
jgi:hypothetical protein